MKWGAFVLAIWAVGVLCIPSAFSQDAVIILKHQEIGGHDRPEVHFTHEAHMSSIECVQCHHDYDRFKNNRGGEGRPCSDCHGPTAEKGQPSLAEAFHLQCKGCHEELKAEGTPGGPILCGECHVKR